MAINKLHNYNVASIGGKTAPQITTNKLHNYNVASIGGQTAPQVTTNKLPDYSSNARIIPNETTKVSPTVDTSLAGPRRSLVPDDYGVPATTISQAEPGTELPETSIKDRIMQSEKDREKVAEIDRQEENKVGIKQFMKDSPLTPSLYNPDYDPILSQKIKQVLNSPQVTPVIQELSRRTSGTGIASMVQAVGPKTFTEAYEANRAAQAGDPSKMNQFLYQLGDTAPQTLIGVALAYTPIFGRTLATSYWTALSAAEQIENKGSVTSTSNIAIDVVLDSILGNVIDGLLRVPAKNLAVSLGKTFISEGGTEGAQDVLKMANDYRVAKTTAEKEGIKNDLKEYFTSGQALMTFLVGGISGAGTNAIITAAHNAKSGEVPLNQKGFTQIPLFGKETPPLPPPPPDGPSGQTQIVDQDIAGTTPIIEDAVVTEAKKYKTADEFINAQPIAYHGTNQTFDNFEIKGNVKNTGSISADEAIFFTNNKLEAGTYARLANKKISSEEKLLQSETKRLQEEMDIAKRTGNWELYENKITELEDLEENLLRSDKEVNNIMERRIDTTGFKVVDMKDRPQFDLSLTKELKQAKKENYNGIVFENITDPASYDVELPESTTHYAVFNIDNIKTEKQLTDIWNEANERSTTGQGGISDNEIKKIDSLNPTSGIFVDYNPQERANLPLADNITTLDKTSNSSPNEIITVYRGAPSTQKEIVAGDFITTNKQLAKDYAGTGNVIEKQVKMSDVLDDITEPLGEEYIYRPQTEVKKPRFVKELTLEEEAKKYKAVDGVYPTESVIGELKDGDKVKVGDKIYTYKKVMDVTGDIQEILDTGSMTEDDLTINRSKGKVSIETTYQDDEPLYVFDSNTGTTEDTTTPETTEQPTSEPILAEIIEESTTKPLFAGSQPETKTEVKKPRFVKELTLEEEAKKYNTADEYIDSKSIYRGQPSEFKELQKVAQSDIIDNILIGKGIFTTSDQSIAKTYGDNVFQFSKPSEKVFDLTKASESDLKKIMPEDFFKVTTEDSSWIYGQQPGTSVKESSPYNTYLQAIENGDIVAAEDILFENLAESFLPEDITWESVKSGNTAVSGIGDTVDIVREKILKKLTDNGYEWMAHQGGIRAGSKEHNVYIALTDETLKPLDKQQLTDIWNKANTETTKPEAKGLYADTLEDALFMYNSNPKRISTESESIQTDEFEKFYTEKEILKASEQSTTKPLFAGTETKKEVKPRTEKEILKASGQTSTSKPLFAGSQSKVDTTSKEKVLPDGMVIPAKESSKSIFNTKQESEMSDGELQALIASAPKEGDVPLNGVEQEAVKGVTEMVKKDVAISAKEKVGILDYFRTPWRVFDRLGIRPAFESVVKGYENYNQELRENTVRIRNWSKQLNKESQIKVFDYLDGKKVELNAQELKIATEIKTWFSTWADRLGIKPKDRISNYITHIFDPKTGEDIPNEIKNLMKSKPSISVFNPYLLERLNKEGYKKDLFGAVEAYSKRATRKVNMDPVLKEMNEASAKLRHRTSIDYLNKFLAQINLKPSNMDLALDIEIKKIFGDTFGARPTSTITRFTRRMIARAKIGLSMTSFAINLTQTVNTFGELGTRYTAEGYRDLWVFRHSSELEDNGVLLSPLLDDTPHNAIKTTAEKVDDILFLNMTSSELINRGVAYYGAKRKYIDGKITGKEYQEAFGRRPTSENGIDTYKPTMEEAIQYGKFVAAKTQFLFGALHTPVGLNSDLAKTIFQFQTFGIKQTEFVAGMLKNKDWKKFIRYFISSSLVFGIIGKLFGMAWHESIITINRIKSPMFSFIESLYQTLITKKDSYGNYLSNEKVIEKIADLILTNMIPGGSQIKKATQGISTVKEGKLLSPSGKFQTKVATTPLNYFRGALFGKYNLTESQNFYNKRKAKAKASAKAKGSIKSIFSGSKKYEGHTY